MPPDADLPDPPPLRAIVRIRIPLVREEPPEEVGSDAGEVKPKSEKSGRSRGSKKVEEEKAPQEVELVDAVKPIQT